ncbi:MAG: hypothetical protein IPL40_13895 [Proteobacteria bacterium]|nr:hypothetical protein [Pseudomonadota bacterium]
MASIPKERHALRQKVAGLGWYSYEEAGATDNAAGDTVLRAGLSGACIRFDPEDLDGLASAIEAKRAEMGREQGSAGRAGARGGKKLPVYIVNAPVKIAWVTIGDKTEGDRDGHLWLQVDPVPGGQPAPNFAEELDRIKAVAVARGLDWNKIAGRVQEVLDRSTGVPTRITE